MSNDLLPNPRYIEPKYPTIPEAICQLRDAGWAIPDLCRVYGRDPEDIQRIIASQCHKRKRKGGQKTA